MSLSSSPVASPSASPSSSSSPILCSSQITHVTVYARGALVTRRVFYPAAAALSDGEMELLVPEITSLAEPGSLRAALAQSSTPSAPGPGASGRQIVAVRSALHIPETTAAPGPQAAQVQEISGRIARLQGELERVGQERQKISKSIPDPALRTTSYVDKVEQRIADSLATAELLCEAQRKLDERLLKIERELAELQLALAAAELAHSQARSRMGRGHPTRRASISLSGSGPLPALTLSYVVPTARFWPLYTLRITDVRETGQAATGRRASWMIEALVAQRTGEDWREVRLALATADLLLDARLPELSSLRLGRAQPPARRGYRPPPAGLDELFTGYDRAFRDAPMKKVGRAEPTPKDRDFHGADDAPSLGGPADLALDILETTAPDSEGGYREERKAVGGMAFGKNAPAPGGGGRSGAVPSYHAGPSPDMPQSPSAAPSMAMAVAPMPSTPMAMPMEPQKERSRRAGNVPMRASLARSEQAPTLSDGAGGGSGYGGMPEGDDSDSGTMAGGPLEPQDTWLDFDRLVLHGVDDQGRRGRLARVSENASLTGARQANEQLEALRPDGVSDPLYSRGHFDHRYDADGLVLVPSDGLPHRVMLSSAETLPTLRLVTVPRERAEVFREAELKNPCESPLLAGPVDVYVEGSLLTTAAITAIDRGGALHVGMGVEDRVRVARNVRSDEENVGLIGGSTQVTTHVSIELSSALGQQCVVEVFERLPVTDDKSVTIELIAARPEAKEYNQSERGAPVRGGLVWRLLLPAGGKAKIDYQYRVLFPAKTEIVGGNRRD